ncbi:MAG: nucleotide exchange factor GrpE [Gemmatimonadota bacterium]|nr:nucleotide exchange factor GrpE [Gemmatimonadota bacterium]
MKRAKTQEVLDDDARAEAPEEPGQAEAAAPENSGYAPRAPETQTEMGDQEGLTRELSEARDRHLRLAADFDNFRKRMERERTESWHRAQAQIVERLLDVVDDLQRIAEQSVESVSAEALLEGTRMVERKLVRALEAAGMEMIEAEGSPFDPEVHEAITTVQAERADEDNAVADVFQKGYRFKGALLRPARVRVKKFEG